MQSGPCVRRSGWVRISKRRAATPAAATVEDGSGFLSLAFGEMVLAPKRQRFLVLQGLLLYFGSDATVTADTAGEKMVLWPAPPSVVTEDYLTLVVADRAGVAEGREWILHFETAEAKLAWDLALRTVTAHLPLHLRRIQHLGCHSDANVCKVSTGWPKREENGQTPPEPAAGGGLEEGRPGDGEHSTAERSNLAKAISNDGFHLAAQTAGGATVFTRVSAAFDCEQIAAGGLLIDLTANEESATVFRLSGGLEGTLLLPPTLPPSVGIVDASGRLTFAHQTQQHDAHASCFTLSPSAGGAVWKLAASGETGCCAVEDTGDGVAWTFRGGSGVGGSSTELRAVPRAESVPSSSEPLKVMLLGATGAGKTCVLQWLHTHVPTGIGTTSAISFRQTIGAVEQLVAFDVGGPLVRLSATELPSTASLDLMRSHCERAHLILFVFDFTDAFSITWLSSFSAVLDNRGATTERQLVFVGMRHGDPRTVVDAHRVELAQRSACSAMSTSADRVPMWHVPTFTEAQPRLDAKGEERPSHVSPDDAARVLLQNLRGAIRLLFCKHTLLRSGLASSAARRICASLDVPTGIHSAADQVSDVAQRLPRAVTTCLDNLGAPRPLQLLAGLCWISDADRELAFDTMACTSSSFGSERTVRLHPQLAFVEWLLASCGSGCLIGEVVLHLAATQPATPFAQHSANFSVVDALFEKPDGRRRLYLTSREVIRLFRCGGVALHSELLQLVQREMDINDDKVIDREDFVHWWALSWATVTLTGGVFTALLAGLVKHRIATTLPELVVNALGGSGAGGAGQERGARAAVDPPHPLVQPRTPAPPTSSAQHGLVELSVATAAAPGMMSSASNSGAASGERACARCNAELTVFRAGQRCAHCALEHCGDCISLVKTVAEGSTAAVQRAVCYSCQGMAPPARWESAKRAKRCAICSSVFGVLRRRHHCRSCGCAACGDCATGFTMVEGYPTPQRVCTPCEAAAAMFNSSRRAMSFFGRRPASTAPASISRSALERASAISKASIEGFPLLDGVGADGIGHSDGADQKGEATAREQLEEEVEYDIPWFEAYDSEDERALFRHHPPPPPDPAAPRVEYVVLAPGMTDLDSATLLDRPVTEEEDALFGPDVYASD